MVITLQISHYPRKRQNEAMVYKKLYHIMAESYKKRGNKKEAEEYYNMAKQYE